MRPRRFILSNHGGNAERVRERALELVAMVDCDDPIEIIVQDYEEPRTLEQNVFYWSTMVTPIADWQGATKKETHEDLLKAYFGSRVEEGKIVPNKRSSELNKQEMQEYLEFVPQFAAEQGLVLDV